MQFTDRKNILVNAKVFADTKKAILSAIYGPGREGFKQGVTSHTHCEAKEKGY